MQAKSRLHPNNRKGSHKGGFSDRKFAKKMSARGKESLYGKDSD